MIPSKSPGRQCGPGLFIGPVQWTAVDVSSRGYAHGSEGLPAHHSGRYGYVEAVLDPELRDLEDAIHCREDLLRTTSYLIAQHHGPTLSLLW